MIPQTITSPLWCCSGWTKATLFSFPLLLHICNFPYLGGGQHTNHNADLVGTSLLSKRDGRRKPCFWTSANRSLTTKAPSGGVKPPLSTIGNDGWNVQHDSLLIVFSYFPLQLIYPFSQTGSPRNRTGLEGSNDDDKLAAW